MEKLSLPPLRQIRAALAARTITVYQAYSPAIAGPALEAQRFVPPFKMTRMTWIKPSFLWMMHRSNWGRAEGQDRVLAIEITREGFDWALANACLSAFDPAIHKDPAIWRAHLKASPARVQWDPERSLRLGPLSYRSIQIGLSGKAIERYARDWTVAIASADELAAKISALVARGEMDEARRLLPDERPYAIAPGIARRLGM